MGKTRRRILTNAGFRVAAAATLAAGTAALAAAQTADAAAARERSAAVPIAGSLLLSGKPFPPPERLAPALPEPRRTFFVAAGSEAGDGSEAHPWNDFQASLYALSAGDRLRVRAGAYPGAFRIDDGCRDGAAGAPIQVVFDGKASLTPRGDAAVLTIRRSHWLLLGAFVELGAAAAAGISIEAGARDITLDGARVAGGSGPGIRIGSGAADVVVANTRVSKSRVASPGPASIGVQVAAGAERVAVVGNHLHENPAGSVRIEAPGPGERPARDVRIAGNTIHDDDSTAIFVGAADRVRITGNTISDLAGRTETRGIALEAVTDAVVRANHVIRCALAVQVGRADPANPGSPRRARDVLIDHNDFENTPKTGTAFVVEAGERIRFVNNVVEGYANGVLVFENAAAARGITAANNLFVGVSDTALRVPDAAWLLLFDYNVFSPAGPAVVEIAGHREPLVRWAHAALPHARVVPGVRILNRDLARIAGVETVDRGRKIEGVEYKGAAPDIGVAER